MSTELPLLFLAGVPKAGTSSLFRWLSDHPEVLATKEKETAFFADVDSHTFRDDFNVRQGRDRLRNAFPPMRPEHRLRLEGTPTHIYSKAALEHIPDLPGDPRCVFILRSPAQQIRSVYDYYRDNWNHIPAEMSFRDYLAAAREGKHDFKQNELAARAFDFADYAPWLRLWRARIGPDRMRVFTFDVLRDDPGRVIKDIADWCGLSRDFYSDYDFPVENQSYVPIHRGLQRLNIALRKHLPKGRAYDKLRLLYHRLNTQSPRRSDDHEIIEQLNREFAGMNARLAQEFSLDLSGWPIE